MSKSIKIDDDLHKQLKILAAEENKSISKILRAAFSINYTTQKTRPQGTTLKKELETFKKSGLTKNRGEMDSDDYV